VLQVIVPISPHAEFLRGLCAPHCIANRVRISRPQERQVNSEHEVSVVYIEQGCSNRHDIQVSST
jgi:hypothetical protein